MLSESFTTLMMPKNCCNNPASCSDTTPRTSIIRTWVMVVGGKDLLSSQLCLRLYDPSACEVLVPHAKRTTSSYKEGCFKRTPVVGSLSCRSWSPSCLVFDSPKLHRFPHASDMHQLCSAQALCWMKSGNWLSKVVLGVAGCHLRTTETDAVE